VIVLEEQVALKKNNNRPPLGSVLPAYMIALMVAWTLFDILVMPYIHSGPAGFAIAFILELLIWTLPAWRLMHVYDDELYIPLKQAFTFTKDAAQWTMLLTAVVVMVNLLIRALQVEIMEINLALEGMTLLESVLLIGFTEEFVFRGWILNAYARRVGPWRASFIAEAILIVMHIPAWIADGIFETPAIFSEILTVFCLGVLYGISFKKSHCLWTSMIVHMLFNFMQAVLFGGGH